MKEFKTKFEETISAVNTIGAGRLPKEEIAIFENSIRSKLENLCASIVVYGPYNAGKSTLINALAGRVISPMGDIPTTCETKEVQWGNWKVYDTPGIDAPVKHQEIADMKLAECECVIFVISADSDFESAEMHKRLAEIADSGKSCLVVCNDKTRILSQGDGTALARLMEKINFNINIVWSKHSPREEKPYVMIVNAKRALKARLEGLRQLEAASNIQQLELKLSETLTNTGIKEISANLAQNVALIKVRKLKSIIDSELSGTESAQLKNMQEETLREMRRIELDCERVADSFLKNVQGRIAEAMRNNESGTIEPILEYESSKLLKVLEERLEREFSNIYENWEAKDICLLKDAGISLLQITKEPAESGVPTKSSSGISHNALSALKQLPKGEVEKVATPAIKELLLKMREWKIPGIKGRWETTLGKWAGKAGKVLDKALPIVVALGESFLAYKQQKDYERALEDQEREIHSVSQNIVIRLRESIMNNVFYAIKEFFHERINAIKSALSECDNKNKSLSESITHLGTIEVALEEIAAGK